MFHAIHEFALWIDRLAPGCIDIAAKSAVLMGMVCLLVLGAKRTSAAARHWILLMGFVSLLILPLLSTSLPGWKIVPQRAYESAKPAIDFSSALPDTVSRGVPNELETAPAALSPANSRVLTRERLPLSFWVFCLWMCGVVFFIGRVLLGYFSLALLRRKCSIIEDEAWVNLLGDLCEELNIDREIQLLKSPLRSMPMTWGISKVHLLLPEQADDWSVEQRRSVLLHELAHVLRKDCLAQLVVQVAFAMHWFNPLVWLAGRRLQIERERACDDLALGAGAKASEYADHLLRSAVAIPSVRFVAAALAMARPSTLEGRLQAILDGKRNRKPLTFAWAMVILLAIGALLIPVAAISAQQKNGASPATRPDSASPSGQVVKDNSTCNLDATIYALRVPADQIGLLDLDELIKVAGDSKEFEKALAKIGETKPLYRANQSVVLSGDSISIQTQTPFTTNTRVLANGQSINTVQYANTGAVFKIAGAQLPGDAVNLKMEISLSALGDSATNISTDVKAPIYRSAKLTHKGVIKTQKPFLMMSIDADSTDANGAAAAHIARVVLGEVKNERAE